jgi:hypothetical protein
MIYNGPPDAVGAKDVNALFTAETDRVVLEHHLASC